MADLIAQTEVHRQVGRYFEVVLNKHLRSLHDERRTPEKYRRSVVSLTEQEVGIVRACASVGKGYARSIQGPLLRVLTGELEGSGVLVPPGS